MSRLKLILPFFIFLFSCTEKEIADRIYFNGKIWTGDSSNPYAKAIATKGNKIMYVGDDANLLTGSTTKMIDLEGKMMVPGFIDNHTHFLLGGYALASVKLKEVKTKEDFINTIKIFCKEHPGDAWIQGGDWDHEGWGGELPRKEWVDSVTGDHPLFIQRYDGHMAFANSKALALAKVNSRSIVPDGGVMIRASNGEPTGVFKDEALAMINKAIPEFTQAELSEFFTRAAQHAIENGITQVNDMSMYGGFPELETYRKAYLEKKTPITHLFFCATN